MNDKQWKIGAEGNCEICHRKNNCECQCQNNKNYERKVIKSIINNRLNIFSPKGGKY